MVQTVKNTDIDKTLFLSANLYPYQDQLPNVLDMDIQPTLELNPWMQRIADICKSATASNATSATIYTTVNDATQHFYLTSASLATIKDVTSTSTSEALGVVINGTNVALLSIPSITLTAQTLSTSVTFDTPILIDQNTAITVTNTTNAANVKTTGTITGFYANTVRRDT